MPVSLIDCHAHICDPVFDADRDEVLARARDAGVRAVVAVGERSRRTPCPASIVRSPQKQKLVRRLPLTCLVLETDSPVLAPTLGERNEPANLRLALEAVAELKGLAIAEVAEAMVENTRRLFGAFPG